MCALFHLIAWPNNISLKPIYIGFTLNQTKLLLLLLSESLEHVRAVYLGAYSKSATDVYTQLLLANFSFYLLVLSCIQN